MLDSLRPHIRTLLLGALAFLILGGAWVYDRSSAFMFVQSPLEQAANQVIKTCSSENYPPKCYDTEIPKLMDQGMTMEDGFEVTRIIQGKVSGYFYCHVLGHNLSAKETAKDPSKWTEVVGRCPTGMCSNGCLHGAAQERFRDDSLTPEQVQSLIPQFKSVCEPKGDASKRDFTGLEQASCYHSLGHLAMYVTAADIDASTALCDSIAKKERGGDYTQTCYEGAYMQIFQPLEPEDFALVKDIAPSSQQAAEAFCDTYTGERRAACHRESWPLYVDSLTQSEGLQRFCGLVSDPKAVQTCYNAMFYVLTARFQFDEKKIVDLCVSLPDTRAAQCFANAASRELETDYRLIPKAASLCKIADSHGFGDRCYKEMLFYSWFNFHEGSDAFNQLCNALPEPYKADCKAGKGNEVKPSEQDL